MNVLTSTTTNEWYTPINIIERARTALGGSIDLDVASADLPQTWIKAKRFYSLRLTDSEKTALSVLTDQERKTALRNLSKKRMEKQSFAANTLWANPPFDLSGEYADRLYEDHVKEVFSYGLLLVNAAPGYRWFERLWRRVPVVMLEERLRFIDENGNVGGQSKKGTTLASFGVSVKRLKDSFGDLGKVILP